MKATLKNYRQSPRKVRLVADLIRGKGVLEARSALSRLPKKAALPVRRLLDSAIANAGTSGGNSADLAVDRIEVNKGVVFTRFMPRARGRATPIRKKTSNVTVHLTSRDTHTQNAKRKTQGEKQRI